MTQGARGAEVFATHFSTYTMDIQAAGIADIPQATSEGGALSIAYHYQAEGEDRTGKMALTHVGDRRYEGHWKTTADNGNVYQGSLYFLFEENGEAQGQYRFAGADYGIRIYLPKNE